MCAHRTNTNYQTDLVSVGGGWRRRLGASRQFIETVGLTHRLHQSRRDAEAQTAHEDELAEEFIVKRSQRLTDAVSGP